MFSFAFILALCSCAFEIGVAEKVAPMRRLCGRYELVNLIWSMTISFTIGVLFGAAGLIAMTAGIMSTLMTIPYYRIRLWFDLNPKAKEEYVETAKSARHMAYLLIRAFGWPVRITRKAIAYYRTSKTRLLNHTSGGVA